MIRFMILFVATSIMIPVWILAKCSLRFRKELLNIYYEFEDRFKNLKIVLKMDKKVPRKDKVFYEKEILEIYDMLQTLKCIEILNVLSVDKNAFKKLLKITKEYELI